MGTGTRLAFPLGTVFGEPWIHLGAHCIIGEQVTLTAGLMPELDLGPDPILRIGDGVVLGRGSHVIADTTVTIGSDCYFCVTLTPSSPRSRVAASLIPVSSISKPVGFHDRLHREQP
jgi:hypothetical protein